MPDDFDFFDQEAKAKPKPINPREIFNTLPKPPGINDLYANAIRRRDQKDGWPRLLCEGGKIKSILAGGACRHDCQEQEQQDGQSEGIRVHLTPSSYL